jgi:hypothetical protein
MAVFTSITFAFKELLTSAKMQQLADNTQYLKDAIEAAPATVVNQGVANQAGAAGADVIYTSADVVIPAGTWLVQAGGTIIGSGADWAAVGVFNQTAGADVANSRGAGGVVSATQGLSLVTRPVVMTVGANTTLRVKAFRNGGTAVTFNGTGVAGAPAGWVNAVRLA